MPIIAAYRTSFSETTVSALFVDRVVSLVDEGFDEGGLVDVEESVAGGGGLRRLLGDRRAISVRGGASPPRSLP